MSILKVYCARVGDRHHHAGEADVKKACWKCQHPVWVGLPAQIMARDYADVRFICLICMNEFDDCRPDGPLRRLPAYKGGDHV
jgi:hypothetical protein